MNERMFFDAIRWYIGLIRFKDIHRGERCFIIGTGPSLNQTNLSLLKDEITFGVNTLYRGNFLDYTYYCVSDRHVWEKHYQWILKVPSTLFLGSYAGVQYRQQRNLHR